MTTNYDPVNLSKFKGFAEDGLEASVGNDREIDPVMSIIDQVKERPSIIISGNPRYYCKVNHISNFSRITIFWELSMHDNTGLTWLVLYDSNVLDVCYGSVRNASNSG